MCRSKSRPEGASATLVVGLDSIVGSKGGLSHSVGGGSVSLAWAKTGGWDQVAMLIVEVSGSSQELGRRQKGLAAAGSSTGQLGSHDSAHSPRIASWLASQGTPQIVTRAAVSRCAWVMLCR